MSALDGKVVLITGASRGVGRATARLLAGHGADVALLARGADELRAAVADVNRAAGHDCALALPADVADEAAVRAAVACAVERFGGLDALVSNAGIGRYGPALTYALADWRATLDVNLTGAFICAQAALPHLLARGGGAIIAIASGAAHQGSANLAAYCASKFGLRGLMQSLAAEFGDRNVRCSTICPGSILTDFAATAAGEAEREIVIAQKRASGKKYLLPEDVAEAVLYLLTQPPAAWTEEMNLWPFRTPAPTVTA